MIIFMVFLRLGYFYDLVTFFMGGHQRRSSTNERFRTNVFLIHLLMTFFQHVKYMQN